MSGSQEPPHGRVRGSNKNAPESSIITAESRQCTKVRALESLSSKQKCKAFL